MWNQKTRKYVSGVCVCRERDALYIYFQMRGMKWVLIWAFWNSAVIIEASKTELYAAAAIGWLIADGFWALPLPLPLLLALQRRKTSVCLMTVLRLRAIEHAFYSPAIVFLGTRERFHQRFVCRILIMCYPRVEFRRNLDESGHMVHQWYR